MSDGNIGTDGNIHGFSSDHEKLWIVGLEVPMIVVLVEIGRECAFTIAIRD